MDSKKKKNSNHEADDQHVYQTYLEGKVKFFLTPFQKYIRSQVAASILLLFCTLMALVWASWPAIAPWYDKFINAQLGFHFSNHIFEMPFLFWVNDVLLTLFFFFVGLEIKREFLVGELNNHKKAIFVLFAAIGGMALPAIIYSIFNVGTAYQNGWGIPMPTDTAFALGVLTCFRKKLPRGIFTFLAALAILDDIGAILVIAIFYTANVNVNMLFGACLFSGVLLFFNYAGFRKASPYVIVGLLVWICIEAAGIHGTVSGILVAFLIPARPQKGPRYFVKKSRALLSYFEKRKEKKALILEDQQQHAVLEEMQEIAQQATTPLQRWKRKLEVPIMLIVLPLFALVNIGIPLSFKLFDNVFTRTVSLGIILGLVIGKPIGILLATRFALWIKLATLPENTTMGQILVVSVLAGIGFTMSLFIANLSFVSNDSMLDTAKAAILLASTISAVLGAIGCYLFSIHHTKKLNKSR